MTAPTFKDLIAADVSSVFLNRMEFADIHRIDGVEMTVLVDENELIERDKAALLGAQLEGTFKSRRLIYVAKEEFGPRPAIGRALVLDKRPYRILACTEEDGILAITLEANKS